MSCLNSTGLEVGMDFVLTIDDEEIELARDVSFDITRNEISTNYRGGDGWNIKKAGFGEWSATFDILYDSSNDGWLKVRDCFLNRTEVLFKSRERGSANTANFFAGCGYVTGFSQGEPLEEFATNSVTFTGSGKPIIRPLPDPNPYEYTTVGTGTEGGL